MTTAAGSDTGDPGVVGTQPLLSRVFRRPDKFGTLSGPSLHVAGLCSHHPSSAFFGLHLHPGPESLDKQVVAYR